MKHEFQDKHLLWENLDSETVYDARIFRLRTVKRRRPDGMHAPFITIESPDWVTVIPELPDSDGQGPQFLLVRQYRHGTERVGVEFPAGMIDPGELPQDAAARELLEETGYRASEMKRIGAVSPNPAFMTNITYTYLARGLEKIAEQDLDEHEILDVHTEEYASLLRIMGQDPYDSAITVQAWHFYLMATGRISS